MNLPFGLASAAVLARRLPRAAGAPRAPARRRRRGAPRGRGRRAPARGPLARRRARRAAGRRARDRRLPRGGAARARAARAARPLRAAGDGGRVGVRRAHGRGDDRDRHLRPALGAERARAAARPRRARRSRRWRSGGRSRARSRGGSCARRRLPAPPPRRVRDERRGGARSPRSCSAPACRSSLVQALMALYGAGARDREPAAPHRGPDERPLEPARRRDREHAVLPDHRRHARGRAPRRRPRERARRRGRAARGSSRSCSGRSAPRSTPASVAPVAGALQGAMSVVFWTGAAIACTAFAVVLAFPHVAVAPREAPGAAEG